MFGVSPARVGSTRAGLRSNELAPYRAVIAVGIAAAADQVLHPTSTHVPLCPLHAMTGIWCPFCGDLRSAYELTRLHLSAAVHYNAVFVAALPLLFAFWLDWVRRARAGAPRRLLSRHSVQLIVVVLALFTVARNLPIGATLRGV